MRTAWIISSGTELALGQTVDTNTAWLAGQLAALGIRATRHVTVPDDVDALQAALLQGAGACDVLVITGGLGPTSDDLTRTALAAAAGLALELHAPSLDHLRAFFASRGRDMPPQNAVQALIPATGSALPNACGTAPGIFIRVCGTPCYALPGVPFEMRAMFEREVAPALRAMSAGTVIVSRVLHTFGLGESDLGERIRDLMPRGRNPEVGTTAQAGIVGVRLNATAATHLAAEALLDATEVEIRSRLGEIVFGRDGDTLAAVVGALLVERRAMLSTAESCTGGLIGALLTDVAGSSRYYAGGVVTYANESKVKLLGVEAGAIEAHGAVSETVALQMVERVAALFGTDYAISATGIAGPTGGTPQKPVGLVYLGVQAPNGTAVQAYRFGEDSPRKMIRIRAARTALNALRLMLVCSTYPRH